MSRQLKLQGNLKVLGLTLAQSSASDEPSIRFFIEVEGRLSDHVDIKVNSTGIPKTFEEARGYNSKGYENCLPNDAATRLRSAVSNYAAQSERIWLDLAEPYGNLALVPWEKYLQQALERPVLRLPHFSLQPITPPKFRHVALCINAPAASEMWERAAFEFLDGIRALADQQQELVEIHVFANKYRIEKLVNACSNQDLIRIRFPEFRRVENVTRNRRDAFKDLSHPWLRFIRDSTDPYSLDMVHFICRGSISMNEGAMVLTEDDYPYDIERYLLENASLWSPLIGAEELEVFLLHVGTWSVGFSSLDSDTSSPGLRLLLDKIAHLRPGPVLMHDSQQDYEGRSLKQAYRYLTGLEAEIGQITEAVSMCCIPRDEGYKVERSALELYLLNKFTLHRGGMLATLFEIINSGDRLERPDLRWAIATQRELEKWAAALLEEASISFWRRESRRGTEVALKLLADQVSRYIERELNPPQPRRFRERL